MGSCAGPPTWSRVREKAMKKSCASFSGQPGRYVKFFHSPMSIATTTRTAASAGSGM